MTQSLTLPDPLKKYLTPVFERKVVSVNALDVHALTSYTDVLVIVEASSNRQATAIAQHVVKALKGKKIKSLGAEGIKGGEWALLDYGQIVIHIFESAAKSFYDLEGFWADAPVYDLSEFENTKDLETDDDEY